MDQPSVLQRMLSTGEVRAPAESGMPEVLRELIPSRRSLTESLIADRDGDRLAEPAAAATELGGSESAPS